jgi:hypothetical protein
MSCHDVQTNLSLYLYGELDFAQEEALEQHLSGCALCQRALEREKSWHTALNSERVAPPLELLSACRRDLRTALSSTSGATSRRPAQSWFTQLGFSPTQWSMRVAAASFLVVIGFSAARWVDRNGVPGVRGSETRMGLIDAATARIRDIEPGDNNRVRIVFDQIRPREITGRVNDDDIRQLLLAAMKDPADPSIRVDSVDILKSQDGSDVRDALISSVQHDPNAAVRLKALEGLRRFAGDPVTRDALKFVLQNDTDPGVRSEAIDVLVPVNQRVEFNPDLATMLQQIVRSEREDDYVRMRSLQLLQEMNASSSVY